MAFAPGNPQFGEPQEAPSQILFELTFYAKTLCGLFLKCFMSCVLNVCGMGLNVSCEEACLQINPGDVPWYLLSFHTKNGGGGHMLVSLDENRWIKE